MKKLFRIIVLHGAPKDTHISTEIYVVAEDEETVYNWLDKEKTGWSEYIEECKNEGEPAEEYDGDKTIPYKDWVIKSRGDLEDERGWEDAYYGVTKWAWEPIKATKKDMEILLKLGIAIEI